MEKYAAASGGRMKVEFDAFTQPAGGRIDKPTVLKNVLAIKRHRPYRYPHLRSIRPL
jgi:hypothetical protein